MNIEGVGIIARGIAAKGRVFQGVNARVQPGDLATVIGPSGSGRTSLLLALSGRMKLVAGQLDVSGCQLPEDARIVRQLIEPARLRPGFELEKQHRVRETITERGLLSGVSTRAVAESLALVGIDPDPKALVGDLHPGDQLLLAVALTAAAEPAGMLVDDVDDGLPMAARTRVWAGLSAVAQTGTTVLTSSTDAPPGEDAVVIRLPAEPDQHTAEDLLFLEYPRTIDENPWQDEGVR